jgi:hypothetical protein
MYYSFEELIGSSTLQISMHMIVIEACEATKRMTLQRRQQEMKHNFQKRNSPIESGSTSHMLNIIVSREALNIV